jgi:hypothetical protein
MCLRKLNRKIVEAKLVNFEITDEANKFIMSYDLKSEHLDEMVSFMGNVTRERISNLWKFMLIMMFNDIDDLTIILKDFQNISILRSRLRKRVSKNSILGLTSRALACPSVLKDRAKVINYLKQFGYFQYERIKHVKSS